MFVTLKRLNGWTEWAEIWVEMDIFLTLLSFLIVIGYLINYIAHIYEIKYILSFRSSIKDNKADAIFKFIILSK